MTLACEDANSKLVDFVTVSVVDVEERVGNSLVEILMLKIVSRGGEAGGVRSWQDRSPIAKGATLDLRSLCKWHMNEGGPDF